MAGTASAQVYHTKTEVITYHDNLSKWVLGQVESVVTSGVPTSRTVYDSATALPLEEYAYSNPVPLQRYTWTTTGAEAGTLKTVTDGNGNITTFSSWKRGVPQQILYPATPDQPGGASTSAVVDDLGQIASVTDENGFTSSYGYDPMGRLASIVYPAGDSVAWNPVTLNFLQIPAEEHGLPAGHWRSSRYEGNQHVNVYYDAMWRPVVEETLDAANGATISSVVKRYDASGRLAFVSYPTRGVGSHLDPTLKGVITEYDALDRVTQVKQDSELGVLTTTTNYLPGFLTETINPRQQKTTIGYQVWDQPKTDAPVWIIAPEGQVTTIERNVFGRARVLRRGTAAGTLLERRNVYNGSQQVCKTLEPETGATVMHYDGAGNLDWSAAGLNLPNAVCDDTDPSIAARKVTRSYDARNRLKTLCFPDTLGNQDWNYYPDGLVSQIKTTNKVGVQDAFNTYAYNRRRLLTTETLAVPAWYTYSLGYGYDANGHLASQSYPSGQTVSYSPNALGQPTAVTGSGGQTYASSVSYHPNGAIASFGYGNGIGHTMQQNARQLPQFSRDSGVLDDDYGYDANGNVDHKWDTATGGLRGRWMQYDGLDRLAVTFSPVFGGDGYARYSYDVLDNLKTVKFLGRDQTYYYDPSNRLTNITNTATGSTVSGLGYDVQGNLQNKDGKTYQFDYGNRLREVTNVERYRYDGYGRRILSLELSASSILSQYANSGPLMYQSNAKTLTNSDYVYLGGSLLAQRDVPMSGGAATVTYQHTDALGSPVAKTNSTGGLIERINYEPYGKVMGAAKDGPGYTGHVLDKATGLNYMQQRYYDSGIGRFLSRDPVTADPKTGANFNGYWYANNNPYRFTDPDGRQSVNDRPVQSFGEFGQRFWNSVDTGIFHTAGVSFGSLAAYGQGVATGDVGLQNAALDSMRENVTVSDGISAAMMGVGPRGGGGKTSTTYTRANGEVVYSGRTNGKGTPEQQVAARMNGADHKAKTAEGYGPAAVDRNSANASAIRGREQQLIDQNGGAQSQGGTSGNKINGVAPANPKAAEYRRACQNEFGC